MGHMRQKIMLQRSFTGNRHIRMRREELNFRTPHHTMCTVTVVKLCMGRLNRVNRKFTFTKANNKNKR